MRTRLISLIAVVCGVCLLGPQANSVDEQPRRLVKLTLRAGVLKLGASPGSAAGAAHACKRTLTRATSDRKDLRTGRQVHVVYMVPSGVKDEKLDTKGTLECSVRSFDQWFRSQTKNLRWRFDTYTAKGGYKAIDVTYVKSRLAPAQLDDIDEVVGELETLGLDRSNKRYLTYVASNAGSVCGTTYSPISLLGGPDDGQFSVVFLNSSTGCGTRKFGAPGKPSVSEAVALHELIHADGMVPFGAPHSCVNDIIPFGHVCTPGLGLLTDIDPEQTDLLYPYVTGGLASKVLDRGRDDYFRHNLPIADLEQGWYLERF